MGQAYAPFWTIMNTWARILFKGPLMVAPMFIAAAEPIVGSFLQMLPVLVGVLICAHHAIKGALKDGWLAEI